MAEKSYEWKKIHKSVCDKLKKGIFNRRTSSEAALKSYIEVLEKPVPTYASYR